MYIVKILFENVILFLSLICVLKKTKIFEGKFNGNIFLFFTNLSALICIIIFGFDIIYFIFHKTESYFVLNLKGANILYLSITMVIYNFVLVPKHKNSLEKYAFYNFQDIVFHCIIPMLALIDWIFLTPKHSISIFAPLCWLFVPILYFIIILVKGKLKIGNLFEYADSYYPYFFIDIDQIGIRKTIKNAFVFLIVFVCLGYIIYLFDHFVL